ncbi:MAG: LEA type 2 family protein [Pseudomonadota bacterium]
MQRILLLVIFISLSGCAGLGYREGDVKVTIASLQPLESTLMEQRYLARFRLQNRSNDLLSVEGMSFDVELNGQAFASGVSNQSVSVGAFDEAVIEARLTSTLFGIIRQLQALEGSEAKGFRYRLSGRLYLEGALFNVPFKESGEIDLRAPAARQ